MLVLFLSMGAAAQPPESLWTQATLYRDEWGVPHVYAETPRALAFAFGYAQAEDHLEAMLLAYRSANGRAAEVLGEAYAKQDEFALMMCHARLAREAFDAADPTTKELCAGFALGVNAWIAEHAGARGSALKPLPPWVDGMQPADVLALWHAFLVSMAPLDLPEVYRPPRAFDTGNAWALAPTRTDEGKAVLVLNPHHYFEGTFRWYEAHLVLGDMNVAGVTLYGLPVIVQGHNEVLGWALTPNAPDFADVFVGHAAAPKTTPNDPRLPIVDPEQILRLQYLSQLQPYYVRTAAGMEERYVAAGIGEWGPVFGLGTGQLNSWRVGGFHDFGGLVQLTAMARARSLDAFRNALSMHQLPCFHVVYADREGNIFYRYNAKAGQRPPPMPPSEESGEEPPVLDWGAPVPARMGRAAWERLVPPDALPQVVNPEPGYVQACGNPPWTATEEGILRPEDAPPWLVCDADTYRAKRARRLLRTGNRAFRDHQEMLYDVVVPAAVDMVPLLMDMAEARPEIVRGSHPDLVTGLNLLRSWNHVAETNAMGMTVYHVWWATLQTQTGPRFQNDAQRYGMLLENSPDAQDLALGSMADAARMMRNEYQTLEIPWGEVHRIRRGERDEPAPGSGTGEPLFAVSDFTYDAGRWQATYGFGYAMVVEFGEKPEAVSVSTFGASENPESPHYDDQLDLLLEKRLKRTRFQREEVWRYAGSARGQHITLYPLGVEGALTFQAPEAIEVRLDTSVEAPAPLPPDLTPFTLFITPEWAPPAVPVQVLVELYVPEVLCLAADLGQLRIFAWAEDPGWFPITGQKLDPPRRILSGAHAAPSVYAVLGPASCLLMPAPEEPEATSPGQSEASAPQEGEPPRETDSSNLEPEGETPVPNERKD